MTQKILQQAAEAIILLNENNEIIKKRIKKSYRINEIDEKIRKQRTRSEAKLLEKCSKFIDVPKIIKVDEKEKEIFMEFIDGKKLSHWLDKFSDSEAKKICLEIGRQIAVLHDNNIIHGDLTTSNMILVDNSDSSINQKTALNNKPQKNLDINNINNKITPNKRARGEQFGETNYNKDNEPNWEKVYEEAINHQPSDSEADKDELKVYFIDFGLSFHSARIEDKAVDLHLIRQALEAKHFEKWHEFFNWIIEGYDSKDKEKILKQFKIVEARGRYKEH